MMYIIIIQFSMKMDERCLRSILNNYVSSRTEAVVVNDASSDASEVINK